MSYKYLASRDDDGKITESLTITLPEAFESTDTYHVDFTIEDDNPDADALTFEASYEETQNLRDFLVHNFGPGYDHGQKITELRQENTSLRLQVEEAQHAKTDKVIADGRRRESALNYADSGLDLGAAQQLGDDTVRSLLAVIDQQHTIIAALLGRMS